MSRRDRKAIGRRVGAEMAARVKANTERYFLTIEKSTLGLEKYGEEAENLMKREGLVAVAERYYGGVEKMLSKYAQVSVMWNDLDKAADGYEYQIHHHVRFAKIAEDGKAKAKFKANPEIEKKKEQLKLLQKELSELGKSKKAKKRGAELNREISNLKHYIETEKAEVSDGFQAACNSHILEFPFGPKNDLVAFGACSALDEEAIKAARDFRKKAIENPAHLATADRKQKPVHDPKKVHRRLYSFGEEMVEWDEDKGENQYYGFKLFWDESKVVWTNTKVNVDHEPHEFGRMKGIAPDGSFEKKAIEEYLKRRPSRQWPPYRERAMDTDNAEVAEDEVKSDDDADGDGDEQAQMPVMQAFPHSASGSDAVESQQSYDGRLQRHTVQQQAQIQESIQNSK